MNFLHFVRGRAKKNIFKLVISSRRTFLRWFNDFEKSNKRDLRKMTEGKIKESILESKTIKGYIIEPKEIKQK